MRNHLVTELGNLAKNDARVCLLTGDLGFGVLDDFAKNYPNRFFNAGIGEQNMMTVACGMALEGNIVYTYSIGNFTGVRCIEQVRNDICYHNANVKMIVVGGGFAYGQLGMSHHATEDLAILRALPNMHVFCPSDAVEAVEVLYEAHKIEGPCYIRLAKGNEPILHEEKKNKSVLNAEEVLCGDRIALLSTGTILKETLNAALHFKEKNINIGIYNFPTVKPIDTESIHKIAEKYEIIISVEEHNVVGGFGGAIAEVIAGMSGVRARQIRLGLCDEYTAIVGSQDYLRRYYHMDVSAIIAEIEKFI